MHDALFNNRKIFLVIPVPEGFTENSLVDFYNFQWIIGRKL